MPYTPQMITHLLLIMQPYDQYLVTACDINSKQSGNAVGFHLNLCHHHLLTTVLPPILTITTPLRHVTAMMWQLTATSLVFQLGAEFLT
jgi:hypothetical protein